MAKYATVKRSNGAVLRWFAQELGTIGGDTMGFHNVLFPVGIQFGSSGGPAYRTTIVEMDSGAEERVSRWPKSKRTFDAIHNVKHRDDLEVIVTFFEARDGAANAFRYRDFNDESTAPNNRGAPTKDDVVIGTGDGATKLFQLRKSYASGNQEKFRAILLPVTPAWGGTTYVSLDGAVALTYNTHYTIDDTTGKLVFVTAPGEGVVVTAGFYFHVPVRFGSGADSGLRMAIDSFDSGSLPGIELVEVLDNVLLPEDGNPGWASEFSPSANLMITPNMGNAIRLAPTLDINIFLLNAVELELGANWFTIWNDSAFNVFPRDESGNNLDGGNPIAPNTTVRFHIFPVNGTPTWKIS